MNLELFSLESVERIADCVLCRSWMCFKLKPKPKVSDKSIKFGSRKPIKVADKRNRYQRGNNVISEIIRSIKHYLMLKALLGPARNHIQLCGDLKIKTNREKTASLRFYDFQASTVAAWQSQTGFNRRC